jgi:hypothetical protein
MRSALRTVSLAIVAALGGLVSQPAAAAPTIVPFDNTTELVSTITGSASPVVLYSTPITYVNGDILQTSTEFEVTNDTSSTVHIWAKIVLATTAGGTTGTTIAEANEKSITDPGLHHCTRVKGGIATLATAGMGSVTKYLNVVVWSDGDLTVEGGKGHQSGMQITQSTGSTFDVYDSGHNGELLSTLTGDDTYRTLYSVNVGTLAVDDILIVFAEGQLEAAGTVTTSKRLSARLQRVDSMGNATAVNQPNAFNISSDDTIGTPVKVATVAIAGNTDRNIVRLDLRATTDLNVDEGYGRLQVLKIHPG